VDDEAISRECLKRALVVDGHIVEFATIGLEAFVQQSGVHDHKALQPTRVAGFHSQVLCEAYMPEDWPPPYFSVPQFSLAPFESFTRIVPNA
jgi:CheY-like chemotaxis protein